MRIPRVMYIPPRQVVKLGERYIVYLPASYNEVWREIKERKKRVRLFVEVVD